jgi:hypothetical protein
MSLAALGLIFATVGATIASWKLALLPAAIAGVYTAAVALSALPFPIDDPVPFVLLVCELTTVMGVLARRGLAPRRVERV